jgi:hypothetical protein
MTTWIEVADTAVKIGFGAMIAGVGSYFLEKCKATLVSRKAKEDDARLLLKSIATMFATANSALEDYLHLTYSPDQSKICEALSNNSSLLNDAAKQLVQAHAMAALMGSELLKTDIAQTVERIYDLHREYALIDPMAEYEPEKMNELIERFNQAYDKSLETLGTAYNKTSA